jgi:hypothetical protein
MKLVMTFMFIAFAFAFIVETSDIRNGRGETKTQTDSKPIMKGIYQSVLSDPEFLALSSKQQLHVLIVMYNIIEGHLKKQGFIGKQMR